MNDLERVKHMRDCNWKPANQYWRELYEASQAKVTELEQKLQQSEQRVKLLESL